MKQNREELARFVITVLALVASTILILVDHVDPASAAAFAVVFLGAIAKAKRH